MLEQLASYTCKLKKMSRISAGLVHVQTASYTCWPRTRAGIVHVQIKKNEFTIDNHNAEQSKAGLDKQRKVKIKKKFAVTKYYVETCKVAERKCNIEKPQVHN